MRKIEASFVSEKVAQACIDANCNLRADVVSALQKALRREKSKTGKDILKQLIENARLAQNEQIPICQDTGAAIVFVEIGQKVSVVGGDLTEAINAGVKKGYQKGYLRKSIVKDALDRVNTRTNTPAFIHTEIVPGDKLKISVLPKGAGSENMGCAVMLTPADGWEAIKKIVVNQVEYAGGKACPPLVVGVGIGGTLDMAALLAKKALLRKIGIRNQKIEISKKEKELLELVNKTGIGPMGLGGTVTALAVHIETFASHIASLAVAVNLGCHAMRSRSVVI